MMADEQQTADVNMNSSQGTCVAARETRPPPSAQDAEQGPIDRSENHVQDPVRDRSTGITSGAVKTHEQNSSFTEVLQQYQERLNQDFDDYEQNLHQDYPASQEISAFDWDALECEYQKEVGEVAMKEKEIMSQFDARFKVFEDFRARSSTNIFSNSCCGCKSQTNAKANEQSRGTVPFTFLRAILIRSGSRHNQRLSRIQRLNSPRRSSTVSKGNSLTFSLISNKSRYECNGRLSERNEPAQPSILNRVLDCAKAALRSCLLMSSRGT